MSSQYSSNSKGDRIDLGFWRSMYFICDRGTAGAIKSITIKPANNTPENSYLFFFGVMIQNNHLSPFSCCLVFRCGSWVANSHQFVILCYHLNAHLSIICVSFFSPKQSPRSHSYCVSLVTGLKGKKRKKEKNWKEIANALSQMSGRFLWNIN